MQKQQKAKLKLGWFNWWC